jgi:hypothetical protein
MRRMLFMFSFTLDTSDCRHRGVACWDGFELMIQLQVGNGRETIRAVNRPGTSLGEAVPQGLKPALILLHLRHD